MFDEEEYVEVPLKDRYFYFDLVDPKTREVTRDVKIYHGDFTPLKNRLIIQIRSTQNYSRCSTTFGSPCGWCDYHKGRMTARKDW